METHGLFFNIEIKNSEWKNSGNLILAKQIKHLLRVIYEHKNNGYKDDYDM